MDLNTDKAKEVAVNNMAKRAIDNGGNITEDVLKNNPDLVPLINEKLKQFAKEKKDKKELVANLFSHILDNGMDSPVDGLLK
jgi:hypothetical protein